MHRDFRGLVGVILASGVALAIVVLCLGAVVQDETISAQGADIISTALGASVGAVATYLGGWSRNTAPREPSEQEPHGQSEGTKNDQPGQG